MKAAFPGRACLRGGSPEKKKCHDSTQTTRAAAMMWECYARSTNPVVILIGKPPGSSAFLRCPSRHHLHTFLAICRRTAWKDPLILPPLKAWWHPPMPRSEWRKRPITLDQLWAPRGGFEARITTLLICQAAYGSWTVCRVTVCDVRKATFLNVKRVPLMTSQSLLTRERLTGFAA